MKKAILLLADGRLFKGSVFGAEGETIGEVCFNTGMTGYQEILTDPSYSGQIINMTYPHIGNYGINNDDIEINKIQILDSLRTLEFGNSLKSSIIVQSMRIKLPFEIKFKIEIESKISFKIC